MSESESDQSDIVIKTALLIPKKKVKLPSSPNDNFKNSRKISTKDMIHEALKELKTRKGVSLYAIKKFLIEKYSVDTEKINFLIKKTINNGVKDGSIIQVKGIGATGSFKLAIIKEQPKKPLKSKKKPEKPKIEKKTEQENPKTKAKKDEKRLTKKKDTKNNKKIKKTEVKEKMVKEKKVKVNKNEKKTKTPVKKMSKKSRKSIGSIIKPPKMKPKAV